LISLAVSGGIPRSDVLWISAASGIVNLVTVVPFGRLADRIGRKRVMYGGLAIALLTVWPIFSMAASGSTWLALAAFLIAGVVGTAVLLPTLSTLVIEQFPTRTRYTGASIGYQIAASVGGGLAPVAAATMVTVEGDFVMLSLVVVAALLLSGLAAALLKELSRRSIAE
jgi:MFS family permease